MTTYLLTWNPAKWPWVDLKECIREVRITGHHLDRWGCGHNWKIVEGDRLFLMRQGQEPRGIIGSGWAMSNVFDDWHWEASKRAAGQRARYIQMDLDALLDTEHETILTRSQLTEGILAKMRWNTRASGVVISSEIAECLEREWTKVTAFSKYGKFTAQQI